MKYKKYNESSYAIVMRRGENVVENLKNFLVEKNLGFVTFDGIGAFSKAILAEFSIAEKKFHTKEFAEHKTHIYEVLNFTGNLTWLKDKETGQDKPHFHAHASVSCDDYSVYGGHVMEATCGVTMELHISVLSKDKKEYRSYDSETNNYFWSLN